MAHSVDDFERESRELAAACAARKAERQQKEAPLKVKAKYKAKFKANDVARIIELWESGDMGVADIVKEMNR